VIPFIQQPSYTVGPLHLQAFGAILMGAVLVGEWAYRRRLKAAHLDENVGMAIAWYILVAGFIGAHLFSVLFYFPHEVARDPLLLFRVWEDVSSFGGMLGGALGAVIYFRVRGQPLTRSTKWAYCDSVAFVAPFGWAIGRVACTLAHDHPGRLTHFPLAISLSSPEARSYIARVYNGVGLALPPADQLATMGFHDLGWYELLYLALIVVPLFVWLDRRKPAWLQRPGAWVMLLALVYAPMRIALDTLRVADVRYLSFTPGQYAAAVLLAGALLLAARRPAGAGGPAAAT
jgi:phosphatidylglycerol:prolipoprotein diacylglycerol transferase